jgi:hypothetical protein
MSTRRFALLFVLLGVAGGAVLALWRVISSTSSHATHAVDAVAEMAKGSTSASALEAPAGAGEPEREPSHRDENFALDGAIWIEGTVRIPADAPTDDSLCVWAIAAQDEEMSASMDDVRDSSVLLGLALESLAQIGWSRRPVDAQGRFRVPCPSHAIAAYVFVDGRYLYYRHAEKIVHEKLAEPLVLEPDLGAWLVVHCVPPANAGAEENAIGARANFSGASAAQSRTGGALHFYRDTRVDANSIVELRGIPAGSRYTLRVAPKQLAKASKTRIALTAGKKLELDLALEFGVRVSGRVLDDRQAPVPGVWVRSYALDPGHTQHNATTAADGTFELGGLDAGKYLLAAGLEGWAVGESEELTLKDGERRTGVEIVLPRETSISGTVTWPDGTPAESARVSAIDTGRASSIHSADYGGNAETDAAGKFAIGGLGKGPFYVSTFDRKPELMNGDGRRATASGARDLVWQAWQFDVKAATDDLVLVLREPPGLAGRVVDSNGAPLHDFTVSAFQDRTRAAVRPDIGTCERSFKTQDGSFEFDGIASGDWVVVIKADTFVQAGEAPSVHVPGLGEPLVIHMVAKASIGGRVVDPNGNPVVGAHVQRRKPDLKSKPSLQDETITATSDANGKFALKDVPIGTWQVTAYSDAWATSETAEVQLASGGTVNDLVLRMRLGGTLVGEVQGRDAARASGGDVQCVLVSTFDEHGGRVDKLGAFRFEHLAPGAYQIVYVPEGSGLGGRTESKRREHAADLLESMKYASFEIREGEVTRIVIGAPSQASVKLSGRVTRSGSPVQKCAVMAVIEGRTAFQSMKFARVDGSGRYELTIDKPGDIMLVAGMESDESMRDEFLITVPDVAEYTFDIDLPVGAIRGTVRGPDGAPIAAVPVQLVREPGGALVAKLTGTRTGYTDGSGRYVFDGVTPGTYAVAAGGSSGPSAVESHYGRVVRSGLSLETGRTLQPIDLELTAPCALSGSVRDVDGKAASGVTVFVRDARGECLTRLSTCKTSDKGEFTYTGLAPGNYTVCAKSESRASRESASVAVRDATSARVNLTLEAATMLRVVTVDKNDRAVRAGLSVTNESGFEVSDLQTGEGIGEFMSEGVSTSDQKSGPLPPGKYAVTATTIDGKTARNSVTLSGQAEQSLIVRFD